MPSRSPPPRASSPRAGKSLSPSATATSCCASPTSPPTASSYADAARYEKFEKLRFFDGSHELTYEFELPDAATRADAVYMQITATFEKDQSDAAISQGAEKIGFGFGMKLEGIKAEERKDFFRYGDHSTFFVLVKDTASRSATSSSRATARASTRSSSPGSTSTTPPRGRQLVTPKLEKFAAYKP